MAKIQYKIRAKETGKEVNLFIRFSDKRGMDATVKLPLKVNSSHWSNKTETIKQRSVLDGALTESEKNEIETELAELKTYLFKRFNNLLQSTESFSKEWLTKSIDSFYNKVNEGNQSPETLNEYIARFIKEIESGERLYTHNDKTKRYEKGSIKNFKGFQVQFDLYQSEKRIKLNFDSITLDFYDMFVKYFVKKDYSPNTIGRHIKNLKSIMRCAREEGLHNNQEIERKKFKSIKEKVENIYLTEKEVKLIQDIDFARLTPEQVVIMHENGITNINHLDIARDVFLVGVYSAQRFSDFSKIKPENIQNRNGGLKVISLIQQKTGERVIIPIRPELDVILNKYGYRLPKVFEQKINKAIKVIGSILDINEPTLIEETKGGFKVKKTVPKYDLIKTHTARRTGCTLMYLAGVPTLDIMKISGHKTEREFLNYIKVGKEETAINLSKHPYFMGNHLKVSTC